MPVYNPASIYDAGASLYDAALSFYDPVASIYFPTTSQYAPATFSNFYGQITDPLGSGHPPYGTSFLSTPGAIGQTGYGSGQAAQLGGLSSLSDPTGVVRTRFHQNHSIMSASARITQTHEAQALLNQHHNTDGLVYGAQMAVIPEISHLPGAGQEFGLVDSSDVALVSASTPTSRFTPQQDFQFGSTNAGTSHPTIQDKDTTKYRKSIPASFKLENTHRDSTSEKENIQLETIKPRFSEGSKHPDQNRKLSTPVETPKDDSTDNLDDK